jgi:dCMP deaminase
MGMHAERLSWDSYFMSVAAVVSSRATCHRKFVGAVIVRDRTILSTGYNGSIAGTPHCSEVGHMMEEGHCVATIHAEMNAIIQAARNGVAIEGAGIYITASPCWSCFKALANGGIRRICYGEFYRDERSFRVAASLGIEMLHVPTPSALRQLLEAGALGPAQLPGLPQLQPGLALPGQGHGQAGQIAGVEVQPGAALEPE